MKQYNLCLHKTMRLYAFVNFRHIDINLKKITRNNTFWGRRESQVRRGAFGDREGLM